MQWENIALSYDGERSLIYLKEVSIAIDQFLPDTLAKPHKKAIASHSCFSPADRRCLGNSWHLVSYSCGLMR